MEVLPRDPSRGIDVVQKPAGMAGTTGDSRASRMGEEEGGWPRHRDVGCWASDAEALSVFVSLCVCDGGGA